MPLKNKKISLEENQKNNNEPYQYRHRYNCFFVNKRGYANIEYTMHCDYNDPKSSAAVSELKRRLSWTYAGCQLKGFHVLGSKKVSSEYLYQNKRSIHEVK